MHDFPVTVFHNPACGTSRNALAAIEAAGYRPTVIEYLKQGWTRPQLQEILAGLGARPRDILRVRGTQAEALGLIGPEVSDEAILDAMVADPILVERPIVRTPLGVRLCRPADLVYDLLEAPKQAPD